MWNITIYEEGIIIGKYVNGILGVVGKLEGSLEDKKSEIKDLNQGPYNGEYKDGLYHGQGTYTEHEERWKYVGEFKEGLYHGQGTLTNFDDHFLFPGEKYVGEWKDGNKHGQGMYTYFDGDKYVGSWKGGGFRDGQGTMTEYKGDERWNGTQYDKDGNIKGKYVNGKYIKQ